MQRRSDAAERGCGQSPERFPILQLQTLPKYCFSLADCTRVPSQGAANSSVELHVYRFADKSGPDHRESAWRRGYCCAAFERR